ncbi:hypothetical protein FHX42_004064 [Saccharopolyspora lacisalsi]|uniref:DNA primase/polymerase bifunctional N-terminal domain-containing protein n=1 Tax=Halosaccharopolyspora lacisalsi TaxID=1000566 RepID=A0A839E4E5_9PSEU|nr:hypothetical protein [Halosaccharopolyspora lacisalsi]MBA8826685.1 hypothetical protein [Halosaccharopolyspora lacisalsi]
MSRTTFTTPHAAATYYRQACGWSVEATAEAVHLRAGEPVEALRMPVMAGVCVRDALRRSGADGPLFVAPGRFGPLWTFLVRPRRSDPDEIATDLTEHGVEYLHAGRPVELPPTNQPGGRSHWLTAATGPLPEYLTLAAAALDILRPRPLPPLPETAPHTEDPQNPLQGPNRTNPAPEVGTVRPG